MKPYSQSSAPLDLSLVRERLAGTSGQKYWRSLEEVARTPEFEQFLHREFPQNATEWTDEVSRRNFLKLMGASLALAGVTMTGCTRRPIQKIVPYVKQPEEIVPGKPLFFATAMEHDGFATGLLVESHEGHPTKIEGNPDHPSSLGATSVWDQAAILDLYDPDRSQVVVQGGETSTWDSFRAAMVNELEAQQPKRGGGLRLLTETVTSPTLAAQIETLLKKYPGAKWHQWQPVTRDNVKEGARMAFGEIVETHYKFEKAKVVVSLNSNFLLHHPQRLLYARRFTDGRRLASGLRTMNRLYVAENTPTITGATSDHRLPVKAGDIAALARELLEAVQNGGTAKSNDARARWVAAVAADLKANRGASIVIAGEQQPPVVHALAHRLNELLGNNGKTVVYSASAEARAINQLASLRELVQDMAAGQVDLLVMLGGNPVFTAPADLDFAGHLAKVKTCVHLGLHEDETSAHCQWHIPQTHFLEAWTDLRAFDGTISIAQPLIAPLYDNRSAHEVLAVLNEQLQQQAIPGSYEIVRAHWQEQKPGGNDFESAWRKAVHDGVIAGSALPEKQVSVKAQNLGSQLAHPETNAATVEISFTPDPSLWDGRYANNGWLQELAKPISKLTWDNVALISPAFAQQRQLSTGDVVELRFQGRKVDAPVLVMPGQAENSVSLQLGYGRTRTGRVGSGVGFDAYRLRVSNALWFSPGLEISKTGNRHQITTTQLQHAVNGEDNLQNRGIFFEGGLVEFLKNPHFLDEQQKKVDAESPPQDKTLYKPKEFDYPGYRWGMAIDLTTCIGCNACVMACQSENNIPVVGKDQVQRGRDMLWIRVDSWFRGGVENPEVNQMPVPCMHCEYAPCELVCPVGATVHDHEGLNLMVYNRCVGTRYCSNNCPYKVRRFNFLQYADYHTPSLKPMRNPNVTVRWRGVMEKCTFCVQRIAGARITADLQNRRIRDGEFTTACAQACPADAIVFGDLSDAQSKVSRIKAQPLNYSMLGELNTQPRTTYIAKVRNKNPELEKAEEKT